MADVIIASAGKGIRMGGVEKQFLPINGIPIFIYPVKTFETLEEIERIVLVLPEKKTEYGKHLIKEFDIKKEIIITAGGKERQDSVREGLKNIEGDIVLIHDSARPFVSPMLIEKIIQDVERFGAVIPGLPISDTIKRVEKKQIVATLNRDEIYAVQTPQGFEKEIILEAYESAYRENFYGTDDALLVERLGIGVRIIEGEPLNIKITKREDFEMAEAIFKLIRKRYAHWQWI